MRQTILKDWNVVKSRSHRATTLTNTARGSLAINARNFDKARQIGTMFSMMQVISHRIWLYSIVNRPRTRKMPVNTFVFTELQGRLTCICAIQTRYRMHTIYYNCQRKKSGPIFANFFSHSIFLILKSWNKKMRVSVLVFEEERKVRTTSTDFFCFLSEDWDVLKNGI